MLELEKQMSLQKVANNLHNETLPPIQLAMIIGRRLDEKSNDLSGRKVCSSLLALSSIYQVVGRETGGGEATDEH